MDQTRTFLVATVLGLCLVVGGMTWADPVFCDTFDDETTGQPPSLWEDHYGVFGGGSEYTRKDAADEGVFIKVDDSVRYGGSGKSVHFWDMSTGSSPGLSAQLQRSFSAQSTLHVEYYMLNHNKDYEGVSVYLMGTPGNHWVNFRRWDPESDIGYIGVWSPYGVVKGDLLEYTENTWYYVSHDVDYTTGTGTLYVEDTVTGAHSSYTYTATGSFAEGIELASGCSPEADAYIDIVCLTGTPAADGVVPEPFSMAFMGSAFAAVVGWRLRRRRRRGK